MKTEAVKRAQQKYKKELTLIQFYLTKSEDDLKAFLESKKVKNGGTGLEKYIKNLIREDMEKTCVPNAETLSAFEEVAALKTKNSDGYTDVETMMKDILE